MSSAASKSDMRRSAQIYKDPASTRQPHSKDDKKASESSKQKNLASTTEELNEPTKDSAQDDVYEFKSTKDSNSPQDGKTNETTDVDNSSLDASNTSTLTEETSTKRNLAEANDNLEEVNEDETKRKKQRKDDGSKDSKSSTPQRNSSLGKGQSGKQAGSSQSKNNIGGTGKGSTDRKSPSPTPKATAGSSDAEAEEKSDLKVPPLKIVIPQGSGAEQETGSVRNGKNSSQRSHQALPYVVPISSNESGDKDITSGTASPTDAGTIKSDEKKDNAAGDDQRMGHHQRVLRSSHRSGPVPGNTDRSSNNSSPQLQRSHSPSPSASPSTPSNQLETTTSTIHNNSTAITSKSSDTQINSSNEGEQSNSTAGPSSSNTISVDLHPRKRKMKPNKEAPAQPPTHDSAETPAPAEIHPHDQPITNCYQLYLNIRKQIEKRRKGLFPVQPKPPQGFKDYLMNRCTYVLAGTAATSPNSSYPTNLLAQMKDLFTEQEKERYRLRMQHVIEKEKLVLSVEQEILRVHGRAARALANQSLPFSVCTILRDEEVYNLITPEQEEKDRNARSRYNGRLFLSWLQDVDDKWEKIKEHMLLRHHNEAESLHAVQKMDWEWKLKEFSLCDAKTTPTIEEQHVPMVHVSDDFDLLPA